MRCVFSFGNRIASHNAAKVVVHAEEVERNGNLIEIALTNERFQHTAIIGNYGRIPSTDERVEECSIQDPIKSLGSQPVVIARRREMHGEKVQCDSNVPICHVLPQGGHALPVCKKQVMGSGQRPAPLPLSDGRVRGALRDGQRTH